MREGWSRQREEQAQKPSSYDKLVEFQQNKVSVAGAEKGVWERVVRDKDKNYREPGHCDSFTSGKVKVKWQKSTGKFVVSIH